MLEPRLTFVVLHCRPFKDTSLIVDAYSKKFGRISLVAKGARLSGKKSLTGILQMSSVVEAKASGRGELKTLTDVELVQAPGRFVGESFAIASYVSELVLRLTQPNDANTAIYYDIINCFRSIQSNTQAQLSLRVLEHHLIEALGVGIDYQADFQGEPIDPSASYTLYKQEGFQLADISSTNQFQVKGETILQIADADWKNCQIQEALKHIHRQLLQPHLGAKPLKSRELWHQWRNSRSNVK